MMKYNFHYDETIIVISQAVLSIDYVKYHNLFGLNIIHNAVHFL